VAATKQGAADAIVQCFLQVFQAESSAAVTAGRNRGNSLALDRTFVTVHLSSSPPSTVSATAVSEGIAGSTAVRLTARYERTVPPDSSVARSTYLEARQFDRLAQKGTDDRFRLAPFGIQTTKTPPGRGFRRADEETRTLDLLHGKQTL
jgi:hypothetical protein